MDRDASNAQGASRRGDLARLRSEASGCERCQLSCTRTNVVFGSGPPDASVMFVGEAPGLEEDRTGLPFMGRSGRLLDELLAEAGMSRDEVFIANVLKCRPPGNRDPLPAEIDSCRPWLLGQIDAVQPSLLCTLGNFATKLLREDRTGITKVHGVPEVRLVAGRPVRLYPLFHPAAALRAKATMAALRADVLRIPKLEAEPLPPVKLLG